MLDEFAIFLLNSEAVRGHRRKIFKRSRQVEVLDRVREQFPLIPRLKVRPKLEGLPENLVELISGRELWRVEWYLRGMVVSTSSDRWREMWTEPFYNLSGKFVEMAGFCDWTVMLRLWSDSLVHPDRLIYKDGLGVSNEGGTRKQRASIMSHVYDYDHVVSAMIVQRF